MVIMGSMVSVSVGQLFMGGVVPGLLMGVAMMIVVWRYAKRTNLPVEPRATRSQFLHALWDGALALFMPAIVLGSILLGIATPTEAAVVAVLYALILGMFVYREIGWADLPEIFTNVAITSAAVMLTVATAQLLGWITAAEGLGNVIGAWLTSLTTNPYVILLVINLVLLVLGTAMEPVPVMLLTVPILFPMVTKLGIDPVHFGVVVTLNLMIGCLTPPVGINLFLASAMSGVPVMRVARASTPFIVVLLIVLALITYIPQLVLWLPQFIQAGS
jgi:C4-dicarboxylate transporter DctM subunit